MKEPNMGHWKGTDGKEYDFRMYPRPKPGDDADDWEPTKREVLTERSGNAESNKPGGRGSVHDDAADGVAR